MANGGCRMLMEVERYGSFQGCAKERIRYLLSIAREAG